MTDGDDKNSKKLFFQGQSEHKQNQPFWNNAQMIMLMIAATIIVGNALYAILYKF